MRIQAFDFTVNLEQVLLWEYNEATALQSLITQKQDWYNLNQMQFWTNWFNNVFNLQTANDFGLTVWSIILNLPLTLDPVNNPNKPIFGFGPHRRNFNNGNFTSAGSSVGLSTEEKRLVLRLRYFQLVSRGTPPDTNSFLNRVFANFGRVYVLDGFDMTMKLVFKFYPSPKLRTVLRQYDLIPRPSGVLLKYVNGTRKTFGFGPHRRNFNNGNFVGDF